LAADPKTRAITDRSGSVDALQHDRLRGSIKPDRFIQFACHKHEWKSL